MLIFKVKTCFISQTYKLHYGVAASDTLLSKKFHNFIFIKIVNNKCYALNSIFYNTSGLTLYQNYSLKKFHKKCLVSAYVLYFDPTLSTEAVITGAESCYPPWFGRCQACKLPRTVAPDASCRRRLGRCCRLSGILGRKLSYPL